MSTETASVPAAAGTTREADARLVAAMARGDQVALERFYDAYFSRLYRYAFYRVGRDHQHAEEVVHDTFMEALEKADRYDPKRGSVESWLITLSRNRIRSVNAAMARPLEYEKSWHALDGELADLFADLDRNSLPETALINAELRDLVGAAMGSLPTEYAKILEAKYVQGQPVRDIARQCRKTEKAVESQLTRARVAFREAFELLASGTMAELGL